MTEEERTDAWNHLAEETRAQGVGNCYEAAVTVALQAELLGLEDVQVVHATVLGQGEIEGLRHGHAWVEAFAAEIQRDEWMTDEVWEYVRRAGREAIDFSSGKTLRVNAEYYRVLGQVENVHEYTLDEVFEALEEHEVYGPWADDLKAFP